METPSKPESSSTEPEAYSISGTTRPPVKIVEVVDPTDRSFVAGAYGIWADLVENGASLGWVHPPTLAEVRRLLREVKKAITARDAAIFAAFEANRIVGVGFWRRYQRPTHWPHANLEKLAVDRPAQRQGIGRALTAILVGSARGAGIEVLTLDARGDNAIALHMYQRLGFFEYGRLKNFSAFGDRRYDKVFLAIDLRPVS